MPDSIFDPNMDPKNFQPIKPKEMTGVQWEEHNRMLKAALSHMKGAKEVFESDVERLNKAAYAKHKEVMSFAQAAADRHVNEGRVLDPVALAKEVNHRYLSLFVPYDKEQLLIILTTFLSQQTLNEVL